MNNKYGRIRIYDMIMVNIANKGKYGQISVYMVNRCYNNELKP